MAIRKSIKKRTGASVVVLGGGNGTSRMLDALLPLYKQGHIASLYALVHMADDGGSTGRLRQQYAVGAVGDLTRCMLSLSRLRGDVRGERFIQALDYRFVGGDLAGHTLRNALLAALEITSDLDAAIATFARIVQIPKFTGVIPTTLEPLTQRVAVTVDGTHIRLGEGQYEISWKVDLQQHASWKPGDVVVSFLENDVLISPRAREVLERASHIVVAPGHTFGSILPTLASLHIGHDVDFSRMPGQLIVVMTLLTTPRQTVGWSGEDFVRVYESYLGRPADVVLGNTGKPMVKLVHGQEWVTFSKRKTPYNLILEDVARAHDLPSPEGDTVQRAVVVHDSQNMEQIFSRIIEARA